MLKMFYLAKINQWCWIVRICTMKLDHYIFVAEQYNLTRLINTTVLEQIHMNDLYVWKSTERFNNPSYDILGIVDGEDGTWWRKKAIFTKIPSKEIGEEIIEFCKSTEILFV